MNVDPNRFYQSGFQFAKIGGVGGNKFISSASEQLFLALSLIECKKDKCEKILSTVEINKPMIAECGHNACHDCYAKSKKMYCKECKSCSEITDTEDIILKEFFDKLRFRGYKCTNCEDLHPLANSVCSVNPNEYYCVWCAANGLIQGKLKDKPFPRRTFKIIREEATSRGGVNEQLKSVDAFSLKEIGCVFVQCCACATDFKTFYREKSVSRKFVFHLKCGHICCEKCIEKKKLNCALCNVNDVEKTNIRTEMPKYVIYHATSAFEGFKCTSKFCEDRCHPMENVFHREKPTETLCVWCVLNRNMGYETGMM